MLQHKSAEALPRVIWVHEDGANLGGIEFRVERVGHAVGTAVAAEECFPEAPPTAGDDVVIAFGDEVGAVANELGIDAKGVAESSVELSGRVVVGLEDAAGALDQVLERGKIPHGRNANSRVSFCRGHRMMIVGYPSRFQRR